MRILLAFLLLTGLVGTALAENLKPGVHPKTFLSAIDGTEQPYNLFVPSAASAGGPLPMVVALHGHGATWESWFLATSVEEWAEKEGFIVLCPHARGNWFYLSKGEQDVFEAMADVKKACAVDEDRIFLIGHSMGGWGTWQLASSHPDIWAGMMPMAGWAPLEMAGNLEFLDPLIVHGDADEAVPVEYSRAASARLSEEGVSHRYIEVRGVGHESSLISTMLPAAGDWFRGRQREECPLTISHATITPLRGRAWWLQVLEVGTQKDAIRIGPEGSGLRARELPGDLPTARVHARWSGEGALTIQTARARSLAIHLWPALTSLGSGKQLSISIDGQAASLDIDPSMEQSLVLKDLQPDSPTPRWEISLVDRADVLSPSDPVIGEVTTPPDRMLARVGEILLGNKPNTFVILSPTSFLPEPPSGDLTLTELLDYYVRPEDSLAPIQLKGSELKAALENQKDWVPPWWQEPIVVPAPADIDASRSYLVIAPGILGSRLAKATGKDTGIRRAVPEGSVRGRLLDEVRKSGKL